MPPRPSIRQRAANAWRVLRWGLPPRRALQRGMPDEHKAAPFIWPDWRTGQLQWQLVDYQTYATEGFNINSIIYSAIMYKVRSASQVPLRAYIGDVDNPDPLPEDHPLSKLAARPNPHQSLSEFQGQGEAYLNIAGNAFVLMDRPQGGGLPEAMYGLRPDRVFIIPGRKGKRSVIGYVYVPEGKSGLREGLPILPQDMAHVKYPNPLDPLEGMGYGQSPMSAMAYSADVDNDATRYLKKFFEQGTMQPGILKSSTPLDEATIARIRERWSEVYGGWSNWDEIGILDNVMDYQRLTPTFEEMSFHNIDARDESRMLGPFGVPGILIGTRLGLERSTYSNYETARRTFWEDTMIPELRMFETEYQYYLQGDDGSFVAYDFSGVPALRTDVPALAGAAHQLWQMGVPADVALATAGLDVEAIPGGDRSYVPLGMMATGSMGATPALPPGTTPALPPPPQPEDGGATGAAEAEEDEREEEGAKKAPRPLARPRD